jgi:hypothetical protein
MYRNVQLLQKAVVSNGPATEGDNIGIYKACIKDANGLKDPTIPSLFSKSNGLNLRPIPSFYLYLP